jgi:hypothetical protein
MEIPTDHHKKSPSDDPPPGAAARYPHWVLLEKSKSREDADAETVAYARTHHGRPVRLSFGLAPPPAVSGLRVEVDGVDAYSRIIAAHGESVLVEIRAVIETDYDFRCDMNYFIYCAGDAAEDPSRPPSLSLLPPCYLTEQYEGRQKNKRDMPERGTALLRRGHGEVLVAALGILVKDQEPVQAELCMLRSGEHEWELKRLPVTHDEGKLQEISCWDTDKAVPIGNRFLFWVDYYRGIIYSDLWEETPELRYMSLPVKPDPSRYHKHGRHGASYRSVGATDCGGTVRFVEVFSRCCCGGHGTTSCARSSYAFNITTWALRMDDMTTWDKVGIVDCDELWSLPGYHGVVPRIMPEYPTVSSDDPDVLCFMVQKKQRHMEDVDGDLAVRLIEFHTRLLELRSVVCYNKDSFYFPDFFSSAVSRYFDAYSCICTIAMRHQQAARPIKLSLPEVAAKASPGEMLMTLREIPDLAPDDMLTTYNMLVCDESPFKFMCLLALPMDMRKGYCLLLMGT